MSHENENHRNKMGMFAPGRSSDIDRCIEETETVLRNTRAFLEGLYESDERAREHVREMSESLERDVQRLRGRKEGK